MFDSKAFSFVIFTSREAKCARKTGRNEEEVGRT